MSELNEKKKQLEDQEKIEIKHEEGHEGSAGGRGLLKQDKKKLEYLIADLLKAGNGSKDKLERIKAIMDE
ncbi:putative chloride channel-like protein CLC-g [Hordeum vulgare]|nr:putative chloride channel-like protein CLC-g [Hordeum vulgare]